MLFFFFGYIYCTLCIAFVCKIAIVFYFLLSFDEKKFFFLIFLFLSLSLSLSLSRFFFFFFFNSHQMKGITAPIIPGIMPIQTYHGWKRMTTLSQTLIPPGMSEALEQIKAISMSLSLCVPCIVLLLSIYLSFYLYLSIYGYQSVYISICVYLYLQREIEYRRKKILQERKKKTEKKI